MARYWTALLLSVPLVAGCADADAPPPREASAVAPAQPGGARKPSTATQFGKTPAGIPLEIKSWAEVQAWIARQPGKVVVIDIWSTYCLSCMKEFPHFVELHEKYDADSVVCASLSVDFYGGEGNRPEEVRPKVLEFLVSQNATMQNFISSDPDETVLKEISTAAIPAALVYDRNGELHKVFNNFTGEYGADGFSYGEDITPLVEQLLR